LNRAGLTAIAVVREHQRIAVGLGARHLPHCDIAGGACPVVDDQLLPKRLAERRLQYARYDVRRSARRKRNDQRDRSLRPGGLRVRAKCDQRRGTSHKAHGATRSAP